jgi:endonuclease-3
MTSELKKKARYFLTTLMKSYPDAKTELDYDKSDPWQLLVVVSLSAQTTDKAVNLISPALFKRFKHVEDFARARPEDIEPYIKTLGLFRNKAKNLCKAAQKIVHDFNGKVPHDRHLLESLAGVGQKTSAVIVANAFNIQAIAVDTHVARVAFRLGLTKNHAPAKIESELSELFPKNMLSVAHMTLILHGRRVCKAQKPHCSICVVQNTCPREGVTVWQ